MCTRVCVTEYLSQCVTEYLSQCVTDYYVFQRSFGRVVPYNWIDFTHLIVRCRGDGRPFYINVSTVVNAFSI